MADLLVEAGGRQDADSDVGAIPRQIVGLTALDKVGGNAPRTKYDAVHSQYVCQVPEGTLKLRVLETSGPPAVYSPGPEPIKKPNSGPWVIRGVSIELTTGFAGQYGPLAFNDPWWKVVANIAAAT